MLAVSASTRATTAQSVHAPANNSQRFLLSNCHAWQLNVYLHDDIDDDPEHVIDLSTTTTNYDPGLG